jgi:hypothetical protein
MACPRQAGSDGQAWTGAAELMRTEEKQRTELEGQQNPPAKQSIAHTEKQNSKGQRFPILSTTTSPQELSLGVQ